MGADWAAVVVAILAAAVGTTWTISEAFKSLENKLSDRDEKLFSSIQNLIKEINKVYQRIELLEQENDHLKWVISQIIPPGDYDKFFRRSSDRRREPFPDRPTS